MKVNQLLFGTAYYLEYMPYDRLLQDLEMMKAAGMNVIRIGESTWSTWEPTEGNFDFTLLDRMLDAAELFNLKVIIGTPTYAIPPWLAKRHPDILALTKNGQSLYGHRQNMDITHPAYLRYCSRIINKMLDHIKDRPCIIGYQIDNETKSYDTHSIYAQQKFVSYLQEKFPDIEDMNQAFGLAYWSNSVHRWVDFPDVRGTVNASLGAEYEKFQRSLVTEFFEWQAEIINHYKKETQFLTHNFDFEWRNFSHGYQPDVNQFEAAKCLHAAGVDIYHPTQDLLTGMEIDCGGAIGRAIKNTPNYLVLETQAQGQGYQLPYPKQLRLHAFSHLGSGANSVMYWNWHSIHNSFETYWKGVLSHDLKENEIYREVQSIGNDIKKIGHNIKNLRKNCKAAILIENEALTGLKWFPAHSDCNYNDIMRWLRDCFYRLNIECDFVSVYEENYSKYELLIVPALYSASEDVINKIDTYVKDGGNLLMTFKSCVSDEYVKVYHDTQPHLLNKCLGVSYQLFTEPVNTSISLTDEFLSDASAEQTETSAQYFMELLVTDTANVWASYNHPAWNQYAAITHNEYHKGTATYLGCCFDSNMLRDVILKLINKIGMSRPDISYPVIIKNGLNDYNRNVHYFYNYSNQTQQVSYPFETGVSLLQYKEISPNETLILEPWDFIIVEEK